MKCNECNKDVHIMHELYYKIIDCNNKEHKYHGVLCDNCYNKKINIMNKIMYSKPNNSNISSHIKSYYDDLFITSL